LANTHTFGLAQNAPVFLETGALFQYVKVNGQEINKFVTDTTFPICNGSLDLNESKWKRFNISIGYRF